MCANVCSVRKWLIPNAFSNARTLVIVVVICDLSAPWTWQLRRLKGAPTCLGTEPPVMFAPMVKTWVLCHEFCLH